MSLTQSHYRFGVPELTESTHGWMAAEDRPIMLPPGRPFLLRLCVQADATGLNNVDNEFQFRHTPASTGVPGNWTNITTSSAVVRTGATAVFANGANCTKRLSGTGTFEASGAGCTHDGTSGGAANDIVANGNSETEIGLQIINADTAVGDLIEFRLTRDGGLLLDAYAATPSVRVGAQILATQSYDPGINFTTSVATARIDQSQIRLKCVGMSASDLADPDLSVEMNVWGTIDAGQSPPDDSYTVHLFGPAGWRGGYVSTKPNTEYFGMPVPFDLTFAMDVVPDVRRVRASFNPSRTCTFGVDAAVVEAPV